MTKKFRHKGLRKLFESGVASGIQPQHAARLRQTLALFEMALRLSKVFGRSAEGWLRLQLQYDLWQTQQRVNLNNLKRVKVA